MTVSKNQHGGNKGLASSVGYNLFIESNHKIMLISRSGKLINSSGMTPEQRNHMLGAVWSSLCQRVMSGGKRDVANDQSAARKQDEMHLITLENIHVEGRKKKALAHFLWEERSLILLMLS